MSFRATVESMSKIMDDMGITELDLERQFLFGVYRKHIHLSKQSGVVMPSFPTSDATKQTNSEPTNTSISGYALNVAHRTMQETKRITDVLWDLDVDFSIRPASVDTTHIRAGELYLRVVGDENMKKLKDLTR